jgi:hypothetical protein
MRRLRDPHLLLFFALLALYVLPLWSFRYFPSQDGPAHLENALMLKEYDAPDSARYRDFYTINPHPDPNWFGHVLLVALMYFLPPLVAEKVLLTGYVVLLPLSLRFALRSLRPGAEWLAVLAFPFVGNGFLHLGFYNFCYSLPMYFVVVGYWLRHRDGLSWKTGAVLALLALVLYFCHIVSLAAACLAVGLLGVWLSLGEWAAWRRKGRIGPNPLRRAVWARGVGPALAFLPAAALAVLFLRRQGTATATNVLPIDRLEMLFELKALVSYLGIETLVGLGLAVALLFAMGYAGVAWLRRGRPDDSGGLLLLAAAYVVVFFAAPQGMSGGLFIPQRLSLFPYFALILWLGTQPLGRFLRGGLVAVALLTALLFLGLHVASYAVFNDYLDEYLTAAPRIESQATVLPLSFSHTGRDAEGRPLSDRVAPFRHAAGLLAVQRRAVDLANYEGKVGYFPLIYRPEVNPFDLVSLDNSNPDRGLEGIPPRVDFLSYPQRSGQPIDYVLLWNLRDDLRDRPETRSIFAQLHEGYDKTYESPRGLVQLYRRKDLR